MFRNDRDSKGGGVFLCVHTDITAIEQQHLVSDCESIWAKLNLKSNKDMYIGSFYMPNRNPESDAKDITCGVPQGGLLAPLLYKCYNSDPWYC